MGTWARRITNNIVVSHFDLCLFRIIGEQKRSMWLTSIRWIDLKLSIFTAWARNREYRSARRSRTKCSSLWSRTIWWGSSTYRHFLLAVRWKKLQPPTPTADFAATVHRHVMPRLRLCACVFVCEVERWHFKNIWKCLTFSNRVSSSLTSFWTSSISALEKRKFQLKVRGHGFFNIRRENPSF